MEIYKSLYPKKSLNSKLMSNQFISADFLLHNHINALSLFKINTKIFCSENKGWQWWASAVFELTSKIPDSDIHFDLKDCNISLKFNFFTEINVQLQVQIVLHCIAYLLKSINTLRDNRTEGEVVQLEEQLKLSKNLQKPIPKEVIELEANV